MKKVKVTLGLIALVLALVVSCAGGAEASEGRASNLGGSGTAGQVSSGGEVRSLNDVEGKEWVLMELRSGGNTVRIDRSKIEAASTRGSFTISFQNGLASGVGWPNTYRAPYTAGSGGALTIENAAATLMAAFVELDELKEHEYYAYLSNVTRWAVQNGKLELYSTSAGRETVLVFELR